MIANPLRPITKSARLTDDDWRLAGGNVATENQRLTLSEMSRLTWSRSIRNTEGEVIGNIIVEGHFISLESTLDCIVGLMELAPNWDSFGAQPIDPACILESIKLLLSVTNENTPLPSVVPTSQGGVQLEWHTNGVDLEVEVHSPPRFSASCEELDTGREEEWVFSADLTRLMACIAKLSSPAR